MKLAGAVKCITKGVEEPLKYLQFPSEHWRSPRTNNHIEPVISEIRRRARTIGAFTDSISALILVSSLQRYIVGIQWTGKRYMDISHFRDPTPARAAPTVSSPVNARDFKRVLPASRRGGGCPLRPLPKYLGIF